MIDPHNITKFNRANAELQEFLLFCVVVAGKEYSIQAAKLEEFLTVHLCQKESPFACIWRRYRYDILDLKLRDCKMGQYKRIQKTFLDACLCAFDNPDVGAWGLDKLETFLGPKTARFFLLHSKPNQRVAVLDTHILKYMKKHDLAPSIPKSTPSGKRYRDLEKILLDHVEGLGLTMAEWDMKVWSSFAK